MKTSNSARGGRNGTGRITVEVTPAVDTGDAGCKLAPRNTRRKQGRVAVERRSETALEGIYEGFIRVVVESWPTTDRGMCLGDQRIRTAQTRSDCLRGLELVSSTIPRLVDPCCPLLELICIPSDLVHMCMQIRKNENKQGWRIVRRGRAAR